MSEETKMVLEMLREGKISADEAASLLQALSAGPPRAVTHVDRSSVNEAARAAKQEARAVSRALRAELREARQVSKEAIREAKERLREERRTLRDKLDKDRDTLEAELKSHKGRIESSSSSLGSLSNLLGGLFGGALLNTYTYEDSEKGVFEGIEPYKISIHGVNGRVIVEPVEGVEWHLTSVTSINANSEDEAKTAARDLYQVDKRRDTLEVTAKKMFGQSRTVHFYLRVPKHFLYELDVRSTNGSVQIGEVKASLLRASTTNGKVEVETDAEEMNLSSSNGRVQLSGCARVVNCRTVNGRIAVDCPIAQPGEMELTTVNGRIIIRVKESQERGLRFTGTTVSSKVSSDLRSQQVLTDERRTIGRKLSVQSRGEFREWLNITAKTVHGPIDISDYKEDV